MLDKLKKKNTGSGNKVDVSGGKITGNLDVSDLTTEGKKVLSVNEIYPVGSIYLSTSSTNPETLFGGKWTQISGRFLYCTTESKTTGGSTTTGKASGNTGSTTLSLSQIPKHRHPLRGRYGGGGANGYGLITNSGDAITGNSNGTTDNCKNVSSAMDYVGGGKGHTHTLNSHTHSQSLPPYFTVYCWYRTA